MRRFRSLQGTFTALLVMLLAMGCDQETEVRPTLHNQWLALAERIPGYGGHYIGRERPDVVFVYLEDPESQVEVARRVLGRIPLFNGVFPSAVKAVKGDYNMADIFKWFQDLGRLTADNYPKIWGVGFSRNRVDLFISPGTRRLWVRRQVEAAGIPFDAVRLDVMAPIRHESEEIVPK